MTEIHQIVDEIRSYIRSVDRDADQSGGFGLAPAVGSEEHQELLRLSKAYASACSEANKRLKHCERLLNNGLVSEAIHAAEGDPNLLLLVRVLAFEELPEWSKTVQDLGLESPPPLFVESAETLDLAFAEANPIAGLLRENRRLALSRAGLAPRIALLERLAEADKTNANWEDDIRTFQRTRLRQIGDEAAEAERRCDFETMDRLATEISATAWREPVPSEEVNRIRKRANRLRRESAYRTLPTIADRLASAQALNDDAAGQRARKDWNEAVGTARPPENDPILARAQPALDWMDQIDAGVMKADDRDRSVAALERAVKVNTGSSRELRSLAARARTHGPLPEPLRKQLDALLLKREEQTSWRRRVGVAALVAAVSAGGLALAWWANVRSTRARTKATVESLVRLNNEFRHDEALSRLEELDRTDPGLTTVPELVGLREVILEGRKEEQERASAFNQWMTRAEAADLVEENPEGLEEARKVVRTEPEKARLAELDRQREAHKRASLEVRDGQLRPEVSSLQEQLGAFEIRMRARAPASELTSEVERLALQQRELARKLSPESSHREAVEAIGSRLKTYEAEVALRLARDRDEGRIAAALLPQQAGAPTDADAYLAAIKNYVERQPNTPLAGRLSAGVEQEQADWRDAFAWADRLREWESERKTLWGDAPSIAAGLASYLEEYKEGASADTARRLEAACQAVAGRDTVKVKLLEIFNRSIMSLYVIKLTGGQNYYTAISPNFDKNAIMTPKVKVNIGNQLEEVPINLKFVAAPVQRSPQYAISRDALEILRGEDPARWEDAMIRTLERIHGDKEVDRLLQARTLREFVEEVSEGSSPLKIALKEAAEKLATVDKFADWKNPRDEAADVARFEATTINSTIRVAEIRTRAMAEKARLESILSHGLVPVGWLSESESTPGIWECKLGRVPEPYQDADLWAVGPKRGGGVAWAKVGTLRGGSAGLKAVSGAVTGRPVFAGGPPGFDQ